MPVAPGADGRRQFRPADEALAAHVRMLAQAYKERPVTLFRVIYALRNLKIQSFVNEPRLHGAALQGLRRERHAPALMERAVLRRPLGE